MSRYRKIDVRIWNDAKFRNLTDDAKLVFLFILTHPHMTSLGAMRATPAGLASELGWTHERLSGSLSVGLSEGAHEVYPKASRSGVSEALQGMVLMDERACFLWVPRFLKYNKPESANVVKSWAGLIDMIPECDLKDVMLQHVRDSVAGMDESYKAAFESLSGSLPKGFRQVFRKTSPNPEPEPEQEHEPCISENPPNPPAGGNGVLQTLVEIPPQLDTPAFREAWGELIQNRREMRKPMSVLSAKKNMKICEELGHDEAIRSINQSIANRWSGVFPVGGRNGTGAGKPAHRPGDNGGDATRRKIIVHGPGGPFEL